MLNNQVNLTISKKFLLCQEPIFYCSFLCWKHLFIFILLRSHSSKRRFIYYYFIESKSIVIIHPILSKTLIHISCKTIYTSPLFLSPVLFLQYFLIIRNKLFHVRFINKKTLYALFDRLARGWSETVQINRRYRLSQLPSVSHNFHFVSW